VSIDIFRQLLKKEEVQLMSDRSSMASKEYISTLQEEGDVSPCKKEILELIEMNTLGVHFQPILSSKTNGVYGYEALTRINSLSSFTDVSDLFRRAKEVNVISALDVLCRSNALREASLLGIREKDAYLFINVCPETVMAPSHEVGKTDEIAEEWGFPKDRIILELTEETAIENYKLFKEAIAYYKGQGYKIAIDDFGSGHGGLKMLSIIEPDFVKIDRHFISNIDRAMIKYNLVESMATACHRIGIKVIAEGVEREEEMNVVLNMGIEFLQGYYLGKPSPSLVSDQTICAVVNGAGANGREREANGLSYSVIGDICRKVGPVSPDLPFGKAVDRFIKNAELRGLPVCEDERVVGMMHRPRFMEEQILGRFGYGMHLNSHKTIGDLMERQFLLVEASATLEDVAQRINSRKSEFLYDDISVSRHGKYLGIVAVSDLLDALTERSIIVAKSSNPLTGLPGNTSIRREIEKRLSQNMHFTVCYIDLDHFKPYNDHYGFERGDLVIKDLGGIIDDAVRTHGKEFDHFIGHIGGDDFILITRPQIDVAVCENIIRGFLSRLPEYHGQEDCEKRCFIAKNRKGEEEEFNLLALSIGIVSTEMRKIDSYPELASIASEVKKLAKMQKGSSIVKDRRLMYSDRGERNITE
jgi:diguanylate cyclase (GGDEF)-like protein